MYCRQCGKEVKEDFKFCQSCGSRQNDEEKLIGTPKKELSFIEASILAFSRSLEFNGRSRRKEFWSFKLAQFLLFFIVGFIIGLFGLDGYFLGILNLLLIIPNISANCRRLHDVGKSGWFMLIPIYNLILYFSDSEKTENQYGKSVKYE